MRFYLLKNTFLIILMLPCFVFGQYYQNEIDSMIFRDVTQLRTNSKYEALIPLSKKIIQHSKAISYIRGEAWGYSRLGNAYCTLGNYKESLRALDRAKRLSNSIYDYSLKTSIALEMGRNYNESKISPKLAIEQFEEANAFANKISDKYDRDFYLMYVYQNLMSAYSNVNRNDLGVTYAWKSKAMEENAYILSYLTYYHIKTGKNNDSTVHYLKRSTAFLDKYPNYIFEKTIVHNQWGKYYEDRKDYNEAIDSYKQAEKFGKESKAMDELLKSFMGLSKSYESLRDYEHAIKYERRLSRLQDSLSKVKNEHANSSLEYIVKDKEEKHLAEISILQKIITAVVLVVIIIALFLIFNRRETQKKTRLLNEKENILHQKDEETQELKLKINESFEEVIQLAKTNSPEFWGRFQDVYPNFRSQIMSLNQDLKPTELILCAYIYLGFTTKDIADYTFKAVKTIKNNKYNLRKRLEIPTENDFTIWMRAFIK